MAKEISRFQVGGTGAGPSIPSGAIQRALGTVIKINMEAHTLSVPTRKGLKIAKPGDQIVAYDDNTFDVECGK